MIDNSRQWDWFPSAMVEKKLYIIMWHVVLLWPLRVWEWVMSKYTTLSFHNHEYNQANWLAFYYGHRKRCRWHTCAVRAHQQDRHMVQINHLFLWVAQQWACNCRGSGWLVSCCRASWSATSCHNAGLFVEAQQKTSSLLSGNTLAGGAGSRAGRYWQNQLQYLF